MMSMQQRAERYFSKVYFTKMYILKKEIKILFLILNLEYRSIAWSNCNLYHKCYIIIYKFNKLSLYMNVMNLKIPRAFPILEQLSIL